jgi:hypothetical protein
MLKGQWETFFLEGLKFDLKGHHGMLVACTVMTDAENKTQQF